MAIESGYFNSVNGDRRYNAPQMCSIFEGTITDGIYASVGEKFAVTPGEGLQVLVGTGRAWFKEKWVRNRAKLPLNIALPDPVFERIDTVAIVVDASDAVRTAYIDIFPGNIGVTAVAPTLTDTEDKAHLKLANIHVKPAATSITAGNIDILVGSSVCPFVTSILQQTNIDMLFANWTDQFMTWWDGIKLILDGDAVGNLLNEIDSLKNAVDTINNVTIPNAVPSGTIVMWSGKVSNIPAGWALCDGNNGTPNLVNKFIRGAGSDSTVGTTGGKDSVTLTSSNLPSHSHSLGLYKGTQGTRTNSTYGTIPAENVIGASRLGNNDGGTTSDGALVFATKPTYAYKIVSSSVSRSSIAGMTYSALTSGSTGSGTSVSIIPSYYSLCFIMKL